MKAEKVNSSFKETLISQETKEILSDYSEIIIDSTLEEEILKEIPIIKTIIGLYKVGLGIKERFLIEKILIFLNQSQNASKEEKEAFFLKLAKNEKYKDNVFEKIIIILDRLDDKEKSEIIGILFLKVLKEKLTLEYFFRFAFAIEISFIDDINYFLFSYGGDKIFEKHRQNYLRIVANSGKDIIFQNLVRAGFMIEEPTIINNPRLSSSTKIEVKNKISPLGYKFLDSYY